MLNGNGSEAAAMGRGRGVSSSSSPTPATRRGDRPLGWSTAAAVLLVAAIAAVVSFVHIQHLALTHGQTELAAVLLPLSIDGTVAAASLVMLRAARGGLPVPWLARAMLGLAVAATLAANFAYGLPYGIAGAALSAWPAVAFIGCAEMAIMMVRRTTRPVPAAVPAWHPDPVTKIRATERVSSRTAQLVQRREKAAVKAALNGHGDAHG